MNHPYLDPSFLVSWSRLTPEAIRPDITEAISRAKENIRTICDQPCGALTYACTFGARDGLRGSAPGLGPHHAPGLRQ